MLGVEVTRYWSTLMMAAGVLLGGSYGMVLLAYTGAHIIKRLLVCQPIVEAKD